MKYMKEGAGPNLLVVHLSAPVGLQVALEGAGLVGGGRRGAVLGAGQHHGIHGDILALLHPWWHNDILASMAT